ncbi:Dbl homology domain-containing protein [Chytriomyces sp. MP71]|nr:Dbl homology domain-containing protein [Chytriomyces sp. MP71]
MDGSGVELKRMRILEELVDSETRYQRSLRELETISRNARTVLSAVQHKTLFANLGDLLVLSDTLLRDLRARLATRLNGDPEFSPEVETPLVVGDILVQLAPYLKLYSTYCTNFSAALETVSLLLSSNSAFQRVLKESPECSSHRFDSFLIMPIQRIPRYTLLLEKLLEYTPPSHLDYINLEKARTLTAQVASFINERIHQHERFQQLLAVQRSISGFNEVLLVPGRSLVFSGAVTKVCRRSDQVRHLFVFSDILIYTMPVTAMWSDQTSYVFHRKIDLEHCTVRLVTDTATVQHAFQIISPEKSFAAYTGSLAETMDCVGKISRAIDALKVARNSLRIDPDSSADVVSYQAPVWLPNKFTQCCMICAVPFTLLTRKHHCRKCGNIVCNACSRNTFVIRGAKARPDAPARACDACCDDGNGAPNKALREALDPTPGVMTRAGSGASSIGGGGMTPATAWWEAAPGMARGGSGAGGGSVRSFMSGSTMAGAGVLGMGTRSVSGRSSAESFMGGVEMARGGARGRGASLSSVLSVVAGGGGGGERCALCSDLFTLTNWKRLCKACCKDVCVSCAKSLESGDVCDACVRGVPSDLVYVHEDGSGWSFIAEENEE